MENAFTELLGNISVSYYLPPKIENAKIKELVIAFESNLQTQIQLAKPPVLIASSLHERLDRATFINRWIAENLEKIGEEIGQKEFRQAVDDWQAKRSSAATLMKAEDYLNSSATPELIKSWQSLLYSIVVFSWAGFECFCNDLWVECVNSRPELFASNAIEFQNKGKKETDDGEDSVENIDGKRIRLHVLSEYGFNLRYSMGTILKEKFKFTEANKIKQAFIAITIGNEQKKDLRQKLDEEVFKHIADVGKLWAIRNLIVHRGGIVDKKFNERMKSNFLIGSELQLNGLQAGRYLGAAANTALKLAGFMDDFLSANPTKSPSELMGFPKKDDPSG